jgi:hypothetical protein
MAINHSLPSEDYERYFNNTLEILKNIHAFYKVGITTELELVEKENVFLCLESFFNRNGRFMENKCKDAYDRIVSDISQKYFEPPSLSREYYSPRSDGKKKKSLRKKSKRRKKKSKRRKKKSLKKK